MAEVESFTLDHTAVKAPYVRLINVEGGGEHFPRKKIDKLAEFVKTYKAKGLAWTRLHGGEVTSSYQKFLTEEENRAILERAGAKDGDLVLIVGDAKDEVVFAALGALRCECAKQLGILDPMDFKFLWVTEFPMFEYSEEEGRYVAMHHPFTAPMDEDFDKLGDFVKTYQAKGLAWARLVDGKVTSSYQKFLTDEENAAILERAGAKDGDLVLIVGDAKDEVVFAALGALRIECAKQLGILDPNDFKFLWVTEFPMFEWSEEEGRYQAMHHPFTAPMIEDEDKMLTDKAHCRARAYDIVLNGTELGGGSIRINTPEMQTKAFQALEISDEDIQERFGHLVNAFQYGAPPHGGLAYGLDRLVMLMTGASSIRDVIAFPKVQNASDLMMNCPDVVDQKQLDDLAIAVTRVEEVAAEEE